jgi:flagellar assembly protein FliH
MTSHFKPYEFKELNANGASITKRFDEPKFASHRDADKIDKSHRGSDHFSLDHTVAGQLGVHERERQEAEARIQAELERRWEQMAEQAEVAGYTKGLEEGKAEAFKAEMPRVAEKLARFDSILREFDGYRTQIFAANEAFLMDLIAQVAGMVALKAVDTDPDYVRRLVTTLVEQLSTKDDLKIYLSDADFENVEMLRNSLQKEFGKLSNTSIEASPDISVGGCKIETRFGVVDASVATQIENVMKTLKS